MVEVRCWMHWSVRGWCYTSRAARACIAVAGVVVHNAVAGCSAASGFAATVEVVAAVVACTRGIAWADTASAVVTQCTVAANVASAFGFRDAAVATYRGGAANR